MLLIKYQSNCSFPLYRGIPFGCFHYSILSRNGASDKPGAIHVDGVCDLSGQILSAYSLSFTTGTTTDTTGPILLSITPAHTSTDVSVTSTITAEFNELLDVGGFAEKVALNRIRVFISAGNIAGSWLVSGSTAVFTPLNPLPGSTRINVYLNDVDDQVGNDSGFYAKYFDTGIL